MNKNRYSKRYIINRNKNRNWNRQGTRLGSGLEQEYNRIGVA